MTALFDIVFNSIKETLASTVANISIFNFANLILSSAECKFIPFFKKFILCVYIDHLFKAV